MIWRPLVFRYSFNKETVTYLVVGFRDFMYLFSTCFTHSSKLICFPAFKAVFAHSSALHFYMNIASTCMIVVFPWKVCSKNSFCTAAHQLLHEPLRCLTSLTLIVLLAVHMFLQFSIALSSDRSSPLFISFS